jgi:hypothetical protein
VHPDTTGEKFFEDKYRESHDPWNFATSLYELGRYDAIVHALGAHTYRNAFEPGCSVGVLTARLAVLCSHVDAMDISPTAVRIAQARCSRLGNVRIRAQALDESVVLKDIDLLVLSEIGYYFERERWHKLAQHLVHAVIPGGTVVAAHWLGRSEDHAQHGDEVHQALGSIPTIVLEHAERNVGFRLDRWRKL